MADFSGAGHLIGAGDRWLRVSCSSLSNTRARVSLYAKILLPYPEIMAFPWCKMLCICVMCRIYDVLGCTSQARREGTDYSMLNVARFSRCAGSSRGCQLPTHVIGLSFGGLPGPCGLQGSCGLLGSCLGISGETFLRHKRIACSMHLRGNAPISLGPPLLISLGGSLWAGSRRGGRRTRRSTYGGRARGCQCEAYAYVQTPSFAPADKLDSFPSQAWQVALQKGA